MAMRDTLTGIQRGTFADTHGWMTELYPAPVEAVTPA
jgi:branched-chain amino acid aminotransferase